MREKRRDEKMQGAKESLEVYLHGVKAGKITGGDKAFTFRYDLEYLESPEARPLSKKLPLQEGDPGWGVALTWFHGLLPEGERRGHVGRIKGIDETSTYGMLKAIGCECAGAVEVVAGGEVGDGGTEPATKEEIGEVIAKMGRDPGALAKNYLTGTLAGAQPKFTLVREDGEWKWPRGWYGSTHIIKPAQEERFPGLVENEAVCMEIARRSGLRAAKTWVEEFGKEKALVVERFDREPDGGRIHQEDFCQAVATMAKYQKEGAASTGRVREPIRGGDGADVGPGDLRVADRG